MNLAMVSANTVLINGRYRHTEETLMKHILLSEDGCWLWIGGRDKDGYGLFSLSSKQHRAPRWFYNKFVGELKQDLQIDHLCRVPACVNPKHLELVTKLENGRRGYGIAAICGRKTHCLRGHEFTKENTCPVKGKWRSCRACQRIRNLKRKRPL